MKMKSTLVLATVAGCAAAAAGGPVNTNGKAHTNGLVLGESKVKPTLVMMENIETGAFVVPGQDQGNQPRVDSVAFDNYHTLNDEGLNFSWVDAESYDDDGILGPNAGAINGFIFASANPNAQDAAGNDVSAPLFTNGTPNDTSDDYLTDIVIDDYVSDPINWGGDLSELRRLNTFSQVNLSVPFDEPPFTDTNGTPGDTSDDIFLDGTRRNPRRYLWMGVNDNGTPNDPTDDFGDFGGGIISTWAIPPATNGFFTADPSDVAFLDVQIPGAGFIYHDWQNTSNLGDTSAPGFPPDSGIPSLTGDAGLAYVLGGGDIGANPVDPNGNPIPAPTDPLFDLIGGTFHGDGTGNGLPRFENIGWLWGPSVTPPLDAGTTLFSEILQQILGTGPGTFGQNLGVNWGFVGFNDNDGDAFDGDSEAPHNIPFAFTVEADPGNPCPADLTGPNGEPDGVLDANDFFQYLALFAAGDPAADLTGPNGDPDGVIDANDFFEYLTLFAAGCP